jgi:hypothetical protein
VGCVVGVVSVVGVVGAVLWSIVKCKVSSQVPIRLSHFDIRVSHFDTHTEFSEYRIHTSNACRTVVL